MNLEEKFDEFNELFEGKIKKSFFRLRVFLFIIFLMWMALIFQDKLFNLFKTSEQIKLAVVSLTNGFLIGAIIAPILIIIMFLLFVINKQIIVNYKKFNDITKFYMKERRHTFFIIYFFYSLPGLVIAFAGITILTIFSKNLSCAGFNIIIVIMLIYCIFYGLLASKTFLAIESYKEKNQNSKFTKFLNKYENFKFIDCEKNIIIGIILHILSILLLLFIVATCFFSKHLIITMCGLLPFLISLTATGYFIFDLTTLIKEKIKKLKNKGE